MKRKSLFSIALTALLVLSLTACGSQPTTEAGSEAQSQAQNTSAAATPKTYKIALLEKGAEDFFTTIDKGFTDACKKYGVEGKVIAPATYHDPAEINNAMDQIISSGYDAVVFLPQDHDANATAVDDAFKAKLPVICLDITTASDNYVTSICTDNEAAGKKAADKMAELLGDKGGKVAVFANDPQSTSDVSRAKGFLDRCAEAYPKIKCLGTQYYENDVNKCSAQVSDTLTANSDLAGIYCVNDQASLAAGNALASYHKSNIKVVGFDADTDEVALLSSGAINALIVQQPYMMGYLGVQNMVDYLDGKKVSHENIDPGCTLVTKDNMNDPEVAKVLHP